MSRTQRRSWVDGWVSRHAGRDKKHCPAKHDCCGCEKGVWRRNRNKRLRRADRAAVLADLR